MYEFKSFGCSYIAGRGQAFSVSNPIDYKGKDFPHLIGKNVKIDDVEYRVKSVESVAIENHRVGENIGLLVEPIS